MYTIIVTGYFLDWKELLCMTPIIGISGNTKTPIENKGLNIEIAYTPLGFVESVQDTGALPFIIPVNDPQTAKDYINRIDALILTGGQDVNPLSFGQEPSVHLASTNIKRDDFEIALVQEAIQQHKPILGVCRGMQIYNVALGGSLYQDLEEYEDLSIQHVQRSVTFKYTHTVDLEKDTWLSQILGSEIVVNSYHHQAIKEVAQGLRPTAWAKDGIIEAMEHTDPNLDHYLIQWHPEWMYKVDDNSQKIFNAFIDLVTSKG